MNSVYSPSRFSVKILPNSTIDVVISSNIPPYPSSCVDSVPRWMPRDYKYSDSQLSGETEEFNQASQAEEKLWVTNSPCNYD